VVTCGTVVTIKCVIFNVTMFSFQMRTYKDKATNKCIFKGSVFVIFKTRELAAEFLKEDVKYDNIELIRKWQ